jgi:recombinational DNA repair protein (RecF pathway)
MLELGNEITVEFRRSKGSLPVLKDVELIRAPHYARKSLERIGLLTYGCELCSSLAPEQTDSFKQYKLLQVLLLVLEAAREPTTETRVALEGKALTFAGLRPSLTACYICNQPLDGAVVFNHDGGGALHRACGAGQGVGAEDLEKMETLRRTPLLETLKLVFEGGMGDHWLLSDFAQHQLGKELKSRRLLTLFEEG